MNILQINKYFYIHGGVSRYFFELSRVLSQKNHRIAYFSMRSGRNPKSNWSKYFVSNIDFNHINLSKILRIISRIYYSVEARKKICFLLDKFHPDIAHLHNIYHHLSPSIILELKKRNIPIVQTLQDYHLISPNYNLYHNHQICEKAKSTKFYKAILHKCIKNSYLASFTEVVEKYIHFFLGWERNYIDYYIAPSKFMKQKLIEYGIDQKKVRYLPNFIDYNKYRLNCNNGDYILYFGRLSPEKGIDILIKAIKFIKHIKLLISGEGWEEEKLKKLTSELKLNNVIFVGFNDGQKLQKLLSRCKFIVLPSLWYENAPMSTLEAFATGKPVIASNIGGIPEIVKDGYNGFLFEPGNVEDCIDKINKLWNNTALCRKMGRNARMYVEKNFGPGEHYERLSAIYQKAISKHK